MKPVYSSLLLAAIGTATASAGLQREAQASQGLRNQTSVQGFGANKGEQSSGNPNLKPIPGSAVQVASLKPLLSVPGSEASATNTFLSILSTPGAVLTTSAITASASSAARGGFTIGGASSSAVGLGQALSTTIAISSTLPVLTSGSPQALETSVAFSNGSEASIATATATAGVVGAAESAGPLQPIPGSAVTTAALQPLTGAESAAATNAAEGSTTSLKSLGGSDTVTSLQALSTVTSITESSGTLTATSTSVRGATTTATNVLSSVTATSTSTATSGGASTVVMSWTVVGGFAGLVAYLLL